MNIHTILKSPRLTEKAYMNIARSAYVFDVDLKASKGDIKEAVESLFDVDVVSVRTMTIRGKKKARGRSRKIVKTAKLKKAVVEVAEGQTISIFDEIYKSEEEKK